MVFVLCLSRSIWRGKLKLWLDPWEEASSGFWSFLFDLVRSLQHDGAPEPRSRTLLARLRISLPLVMRRRRRCFTVSLVLIQSSTVWTPSDQVTHLSASPPLTHSITDTCSSLKPGQGELCEPLGAMSAGDEASCRDRDGGTELFISPRFSKDLKSDSNKQSNPTDWLSAYKRFHNWFFSHIKQQAGTFWPLLVRSAHQWWL